MKKLIITMMLVFGVGLFANDVEARSSKKSKAKQRTKKTRSVASTKSKKKPASKSALRNRVKSVTKMLSGQGRGLASAKKPLEVRGQSRQLSMMLVLKNSKDKIEFVKVRENFEKEILNTSY